MRIDYAQMSASRKARPKRGSVRRSKRATPPRKAATNLSVRVDLVRRAKALKLNLSKLLETALVAAIREHERKTWVAENTESIDAYNMQVARHGLFSDEWRRF